MGIRGRGILAQLIVNSTSRIQLIYLNLFPPSTNRIHKCRTWSKLVYLIARDTPHHSDTTSWNLAPISDPSSILNLSNAPSPEMAQSPALFTASRRQTLTYLLAVCPFSIAFLVFINSSVSFVATDLIGLHDGEGDAVGTLGFADEVLALAACPLWGVLSDRIGVRYVSYPRHASWSVLTTNRCVLWAMR